jgi:hypothetical protein
MFSILRRQFGIPGVVAVVALVFAMLGGAYAAKKQGFVITKLSQIKPSVRNQLKGKQGAPGPKGDAGAKGDSGAPGAGGSPGSPWTIGGVVPSGETLVGSWSAENQWATAENNVQGFYRVPISFGIPVSSAPTVRLFSSGLMFSIKPDGELVLPPGTETEFKALCPGSASDPQAKPGNLCIYLGEAENALYAIGKLGGDAAFTYGWSLPLSLEAEGHASGSWAVTGT